MEDQKFLNICERYKREFADYPETEYAYWRHILWMLDQIPGFLEEGRKEKSNRWLGFIQGALWAQDIYTIEEMKDHNRP
jgi:hypothetical protein